MIAILAYSTKDLWDSVALTIAGMSIVFVALSLITVFIAMLPRLLNAMSGVLPEEKEPHAAAGSRTTAADDEAVLAAIGFALHAQVQEGKRRA